MTDLAQRPDLELLEAIGAMFDETDPVPESVLASAKASLTWRTVDVELSELVDDTALRPTAGIRGPHGPRLLTFGAPEVSVVVEVAEIGPTRRLVGQLGDPRNAAIEVRFREGTTWVEADHLGRFVVDGVPAGPVSLICRFPGSDIAPLVTDWVNL
ncbi:MAG: hypothetical protein L0Y54_14070 [Sporichthyaceae bacterium]|nr:hypothetical protein [Sporichthyaceae bacterium]